MENLEKRRKPHLIPLIMNVDRLSFIWAKLMMRTSQTRLENFLWSMHP